MFISFISSDFVEKIIQRYSVELILTLLLVKLLSYIINSKLFLLILYLSKTFSSPIFTYLYSKVINHKVFNTMYLLKSKKYLKYIGDQKDRDQLGLVIDMTLVEFLKKDSFLIAINVKTMLLSSKIEFLNLLIREVENSRLDQASTIKDLVNRKKITKEFADKYTAWTDLIYHCTTDRVKDLIPNNFNNYKSFVQFLYIINDMINMYMDQVTTNVNLFRSSRRCKDENRRRDSKDSKKINRDRYSPRSAKRTGSDSPGY